MAILSTSLSFDGFLKSSVSHQLTFYIAAVLLVALTAESCLRLLHRDSLGIMIGVYVTVFAWYFADPFINPEEYDYFPPSSLGQSYGQVILFLIGFRLFAPVAMRWILQRRSSGVFEMPLTPEQILRGVAAIWLVLFIIGIARMGGNVMGAVLPLDGRAGPTMWGRSGVESSATGFLVSFAGYLFNAITAFLGVLIFFQRRAAWRYLAAAMFAITLPYFFFAGARSHFLAAVMPFILTYLFYGRHKLILKLAILAIAFLCLNAGFKFVRVFRLGGFREALAGQSAYEFTDKDQRQTDLSMIQELCFVNLYLDSGDTSPAYGARYLNELLNFIPRSIWPSKPLIGIDYAKWRGFESDSEDNDLGVNTTISSGMIGGGVLNFGPVFGPIAAGILMALWIGLLIRWWEQRQSLLRLVLFMLGAGLTFNLGRDISMLVLWPVIFGYFFVRLVEIWGAKRFGRIPQMTTTAPANPGTMQVVTGPLSH